MLKDCRRSQYELRAMNAFKHKSSLRKNIQTGLVSLLFESRSEELDTEIIHHISSVEYPEFYSGKLSTKDSHRIVDVGSSSYFIASPRHSHNPIIYTSQSFLDLTGYSAKQVFGKPYPLINGEKSDKNTITNMESCISKGEDSSFKLLVYRSDGSSFDCMFDSYVIRDHNNTAITITCVVIPIKIDKSIPISCHQNSSKCSIPDNLIHEETIEREDFIACIVQTQPTLPPDQSLLSPLSIEDNLSIGSYSSSSSEDIDITDGDGGLMDHSESPTVILLPHYPQSRGIKQGCYGLSVSDMELLSIQPNSPRKSSRKSQLFLQQQQKQQQELEQPQRKKEEKEVDRMLLSLDDMGDFIYIAPKCQRSSSSSGDEFEEACQAKFIASYSRSSEKAKDERSISSSCRSSSSKKNSQKCKKDSDKSIPLPKDTKEYYLRLGISNPRQRPVLRRSISRTEDLNDYFSVASKRTSSNISFPIMVFHTVVYNDNNIVNTVDFWTW